MNDQALVTIDEETQLPSVQMENLPSNPIEMLGVAVMSGNLDVDSMKALMELEKEYRGQQAKAAYDKAMASFSAKKQTIKTNKKGEGPGGSIYAYADFPQMVKVITPWLKAAKLSFVHLQDAPVIDNGKIAMVLVYCQVTHADGHSGEKVCFPAMPNQKLANSLSPAQLIQQAITYAKRQTLAMALGLATSEDADDPDGMGQSEPKSESNVTQAKGTGSTANAAMVRNMEAGCKNKGIDPLAVAKHHGFNTLSDVTGNRVNEILEFIKAQG